LAYHASWHEAKKEAKETWILPANLPADYLSQKDASLTKRCTAIWSIKPTLVEHSACVVQRSHTPAALSLRSLVTRTAKKLCCVPETFKSPSPIASESLCWIMRSPALCASSPSTYLAIMPLAAQRKEMLLFDTIRFATWLIVLAQTRCSHLLWRRKVFLETRLVAVLTMWRFQRWAEGKALVIDVAVTSPLVDTYVRLEDPCNWYAATQKHGKYDASFKDTQYTFSAMVFETLGAVNDEGEEVLRQLFRFAAKRLGREFTSYCGWAWTDNLQRSVSQAILNRIDGREFDGNLADV
jgi:hypothetical protein